MRQALKKQKEQEEKLAAEKIKRQKEQDKIDRDRIKAKLEQVALHARACAPRVASHPAGERLRLHSFRCGCCCAG